MGTLRSSKRNNGLGVSAGAHGHDDSVHRGQVLDRRHDGIGAVVRALSTLEGLRATTATWQPIVFKSRRMSRPKARSQSGPLSRTADLDSNPAARSCPSISSSEPAASSRSDNRGRDTLRRPRNGKRGIVPLAGELVVDRVRAVGHAVDVRGRLAESRAVRDAVWIISAHESSRTCRRSSPRPLRFSQVAQADENRPSSTTR